MTDKLKACPYCGHEPDSRISDTDGNKYYTCGSKWCRNGNWYALEEWNARPLEDALQKRIDELTHKNEVLMDSYLESETINDKGELVGSLQYFRQRIDDLEAQLAQVAEENDWMKYPEPPESGAK